MPTTRELAQIFSDVDADELLWLELHHRAMEALRKEIEEGGTLKRGSVFGRKYKERRRELGQMLLQRDYFDEVPLHGPEEFRRRFRMFRPLFLKIVDAIGKEDDYFVQKKDAAGKLGFSAIAKATAAMRQLAYGVPADAVDDYLRIGEETARQCLLRFCQAVIDVFGETYLRTPNESDMARLLAQGEARGFPGMLGSVDCTHWIWKNCPKAWHGMYRGKEGEATVILEAVADFDLWIWHAYFGLPGSLNDINVLDRSPLFLDLAAGRTPPVAYRINENEYTIGYYLADGIYPKWATLVQSIKMPENLQEQHFNTMQESVRKDVERAFGVLKARYHIIQQPARHWNIATLTKIINACIILHNMTIEDERGTEVDYEYDDEATRREKARRNKNRKRVRVSTSDSDGIDVNPEEVAATTLATVPGDDAVFKQYLSRYQEIRDTQKHQQLQDDLVVHLWKSYGKVK